MLQVEGQQTATVQAIEGVEQVSGAQYSNLIVLCRDNECMLLAATLAGKGNRSAGRLGKRVKTEKAWEITIADTSARCNDL